MQVAANGVGKTPREGASANAASLKAAVDSTAADERIGVVFVHGVGSQPQSATVREFAQPLLDWLRQWHLSKKEPNYRVLWSRLSYGAAADTPARFAVHIPRTAATTSTPEHKSQTWIIAEGWWAARLVAPTLTRMVSWSARTQGRMFLRLVRWQLRRGSLFKNKPPQARAEPRWFPRLMSSLASLLLAGIYLVALGAGFLPLGILWLAGHIPIETLQRFIVVRLLGPLLTQNIGDFFVYMYDDVQALHIRQGVIDAICELVNEYQCERIVLMGHSQGTVIAYDILTAELADDPDAETIAWCLKKVETLITAGTALNNAWDAQPDGHRLPRDLNRGAPVGRRWVNVFSDHDPVPGGPLAPGGGATLSGVDDVQVWNQMNVLTDHGGYFRNPEQFVSRLAQEIDTRVSHRTSRFYPGPDQQTLRRRRRELRLSYLVSWRLVAIALFVWVVGVRYLGPSPQDAGQDGREVWTTAISIPAVGGLLGIPTTAVVTTRDTAKAAAQSGAHGAATSLNSADPQSRHPLLLPVDYLLAIAQAVVLVLTTVAFLILSVGTWLGIRGLAVATLALAFAAVYSLTMLIFFDPWHTREGRESARVDYAPGPWTKQVPRLFVVHAIVIGTAALFSRIPSFVELRQTLEAAIRTAAGG